MIDLRRLVCVWLVFVLLASLSPLRWSASSVLGVIEGTVSSEPGERERGFSADWRVTLRRRVPVSEGSRHFHIRESQHDFSLGRTAVIICDLWDAHHSFNATERVNEMAPRVEAFVNRARQGGAVIIHAPSDCMAAYENHAGRRRAREVPVAPQIPAGVQQWCTQIPAEQAGTYPIDQSDGGEDDDPVRNAAWADELRAAGRNPRQPWLRQHPEVTIDAARDYITDQGPEVWSILHQHDIEQVLLVGVHVNMCVLGRPFGLRNLVAGGRQAVLVRDLTDSMYNPASWPYVNHHTGTDLIIQHIEKYVCPTMTSDQLLGDEPFRFASDLRPRLLMVIAEPEYQTDDSLADFALPGLGQEYAVECVYGSANDPAEIPGLALLAQADVALLSVRRRPLTPADMSLVRAYVQSRKPLVGIRTASHPFHWQDRPAPSGLESWPTFDAEVWGGNYQGHFGNDQQPTVTRATLDSPDAWLADWPETYASPGSLYRTAPLAEAARPLLWGSIDGQDPQPVAWTYRRADGGVSFYTSLGHAGDFAQPAFQYLLKRGIAWTLETRDLDR